MVLPEQAPFPSQTSFFVVSLPSLQLVPCAAWVGTQIEPFGDQVGVHTLGAGHWMMSPLQEPDASHVSFDVASLLSSHAVPTLAYTGLQVEPSVS